jgi:hypothetical protein
MGLIKTAMMTGGAVYAVNKLAKSQQASHQQQQQQYQQGPPPQQRGYPQEYARNGSPSQSREFQNQNGSPSQSREFQPQYESNYDARYEQREQYYAPPHASRSAQSEKDMQYPYDPLREDRQHQMALNAPPTYSPRPEAYQSGYVLPEDHSYDHTYAQPPQREMAYPPQRGQVETQGSPAGGFAQMAAGLASTAMAGDEKKEKKHKGLGGLLGGH